MKITTGLLLLGAVLGGCSVPAAEDAGRDDSVAVNADTDGLDPQGITFRCPSPTLGAPDTQSSTYGASDPTDPCDWFTTEFSMGNGTSNYAFKVTAKSLSSQQIFIGTQADCETSTMTSHAWGKTKAFWTWEGGQFVYHAPEWVSLAPSTQENGTWSGTACSFPRFQQAHGLGTPTVHGAIPVEAGPYTHVRVATKSTLNAVGGVVKTGQMQATASWY